MAVLRDIELLRTDAEKLGIKARAVVAALEGILEEALEEERLRLAQSAISEGLAGRAAEALSGAGDEVAGARDLAERFLSWAEGNLALTRHGDVGGVVTVEVERLARYVLPHGYEPPASGTVMVRILRPAWKRKGSVLGKPMVEIG